MIQLLGRVLVTAFGLWLADVVLDGVDIGDVTTLWLTAALLGVANFFVRPVVLLLTFPITFVTLGLFVFVINGAMVLLVARVVPGFTVSGLGPAILASMIVGVTNWVVGGPLKRKDRSKKQR